MLRSAARHGMSRRRLRAVPTARIASTFSGPAVHTAGPADPRPGPISAPSGGPRMINTEW
jgi:hypothetical protein